MASLQEQRSEETKAGILAAAGKLFGSKGYDAVTMREIAKEAGCSHTTIYIYFKDKEALLHHLSMPPLEALMLQIDRLLESSAPPEDTLKAISLSFIEFCFIHRNMYDLIIHIKSVRVDEQNPELPLNQARNMLFAKLNGAVQTHLQLPDDDRRLLQYARIYYFMLHGIVATYTNSEETAEQLMSRLKPTFEQAFHVLLAGIRGQMNR